MASTHGGSGKHLGDEQSHQKAWVEPKKRTMGATERDERARAEWRERVKQLDPKSLVFVDESGSNTALAPLYGWAPKGQRAIGSAPRNRGANTTLIASMTTEGMGPAMTLTGAADTKAFEAYVESVLAPSLESGKVVVMDNLSIHKSERVRQLIEDKGCWLLFLPAYSPDLAPIEEAFSKLKGILRRAEARTRDALEAAISETLSAIAATDALGWFRHCGYPVQ